MEPLYGRPRVVPVLVAGLHDHSIVHKVFVGIRLRATVVSNQVGVMEE
jgi:hypothetical protein